jgi:ferredoxin
MKTKLFMPKLSIKLIIASILFLFSFSTAIALGLFKYGVEQEDCQGCGLCVEITGYLFELDVAGLAMPTQSDLIFQFERDLVEEAQDNCPAKVIWTNF